MTAKKRKAWKDTKRRTGKGAMRKTEPGVPVVIQAPPAQAVGRKDA